MAKICVTELLTQAFFSFQSFRDATGYKGLLFTDPSRELFKKLGMLEIMQMGPKMGKQVMNNR